MSAPQSKHVERLVKNVARHLDEWNHAEYFLAVIDSEGVYHTMKRATARSSVDMVQYLLDDVRDTLDDDTDDDA